MKHLFQLALISVLLSGCADTPLKEASIEDRALMSASAKPDPAAPVVEKSEAASTTGVKAPAISDRPIDAETAKKVPIVETRGISTQNPEAKSLASTTEKPTPSVKPGKTPDDADQADGLKFVAQPVLDPKDPQSPLAQRRLLFDYDSSAIRDEYRSLLEMHAQFLMRDNAAKLILQGHADERGSREYNLALGQRRAESVYKALNLLGVPETQMEAVSLGEEKPVVEGHDEASWAQNRRTEILYQGE